MKLTSLVYILLLSFILHPEIYSQHRVNIKTLRSAFVIKENQKKYYKKTVDFIHNTFASPVNSDNERDWINAFQDAELILYRNSTVKNAIKYALDNYKTRTDKFNYKVLECASTLFPHAFPDRIELIFKNTDNPQIFAASLTILKRQKYKNRPIKFYLKALTEKFADWQKNPVLLMLHKYLSTSANKLFAGLPSLEDLLRFPFEKNKTVIFTFLRHDRIYPGLTIIRKPDGKFARNDDGKIFSIHQLGYSFSNFPGFLKNGNTPQGIFSIVGWYITPTKSIGPTPNVLTRLPFEVPPDIFFHHKIKSKRWSIDNYETLIPKSWKNYFPLYESFYAGKSGRKLLIMHGSTDNLEFYKNEPYYPHTPTQGCLSSIEIWNTDTGKVIKSDQAKLMNEFYSTGVLEGYLVVIEINDKKAPVTLKELNRLILKAEK